jgi:hypothetical protein
LPQRSPKLSRLGGFGTACAAGALVLICRLSLSARFSAAKPGCSMMLLLSRFLVVLDSNASWYA